MLLNILQSAGQSLLQRVSQSKMSVVSLLRNSRLDDSQKSIEQRTFLK